MKAEFIDRNAKLGIAIRRIWRIIWRLYLRFDRALHPPAPHVPFDELFPGIDKLHHHPPEKVSTPEAPSLPMYKRRYREMQSDVLTLQEDFSAIIPGAIYSPRNNVVLDREGRILAESYDRQIHLADSHYSRRELNSDHAVIAGPSSLLRSTARAYYHVLLDWMPRLLALNAPPFQDFDEIKLLCSSEPSEMESFLAARLAPANCRITPVDVKELYVLERLIFTTFKSQTGYLPRRYVDMFRERVLPDRPSKRDKRLLISRQNASKRRVANFLELEHALSQFGFQTVRPEELSIAEEIELFYDADWVVGAHGSGLANAIFCQNVNMIELFATKYFVPHFYLLCKSFDHNYGFVMGTGDDWFPKQYTVNVSAVVSQFHAADRAPIN